MIAMIQPLSVGNALRLFLQPPSGAISWRVLRKAADTFYSEVDPDAVIAYEGSDPAFVDASFLQNEVIAFYRPFYETIDGAWVPGPTATGTPSATYKEQCTDVLSLVRDRLEAGFKVEVERGTAVADLGYLQVFTSPPLIEGDMRFPCVSVHLESERPAERGIGEDIGGDNFDAIGFSWSDGEGWLASVTLQIIVWSLNPTERNELRKALRRIVLANLPVFSDAGLSTVALDVSDSEELTGIYGCPMFQVMGSFTCLAPARVGASIPAISSVIATETNV
jgi:hypothetical protein